MISRKQLFWLIFLLVVIFTSCSEKREEGPLISSKNELYPYLDSLEQTYELACKEALSSDWEGFTEGRATGNDEKFKSLRKIFSDTATFNIIKRWRDISGSLADKLLSRRLELWYRAFLGSAIDFDSSITFLKNKIQQDQFNLRYTLAGKQLTKPEVIKLIGNEKKHQARIKMWNAVARQDTFLLKNFLSLVRLQNAKAREFGFPNYFSLYLYLQSIDEARLIQTINATEELSRPDFEKLLASVKKRLCIKRFNSSDIPFIQKEAYLLPDKYFRGDSLRNTLYRDINNIGFITDSLHVGETVMKNGGRSHSLSLEIPRDNRFAYSNAGGMPAYKSAFYNFGRILHYASVDVEYPILKGYNLISGTSCQPFLDGSAGMYSELIEDSLWLSTHTKIKAKEYRQYRAKKRPVEVFNLRKLLHDYYIEYEIYKKPDQDLDILCREIFARCFTDTLDSTQAVWFNYGLQPVNPPGSAMKILLSGMISAQLEEALASKFGKERLSDSTIAVWLTSHLYKSGETTEWSDRVRNTTGKSTEPGAYLRKLGIEAMTLITKNSK